MEFYVPTETGEFLAFSAAVVTALIGLLGLFAPGLALRLSGLELRDSNSEGLAAARSIGGFHAGLAIAALLLAQSWIYLAMGGAFALAAFGRILSMMSDRSFGVKSLILLFVQGILAGLPLAYVFGFL
ncbi:DUF4345 domain-containing protein [Sinorhizobium sp. BG8]|uniref:AGROH133_08824 family phage infection protein n=1 Tax=Sinorhizobium sp. BG8 TaxID=2613773 RepID=UPI00193D8F34|nr:DUF4345 domain-containing protein [Sinorhizobium sp. BG8]QRM53425.1 DUF4345 domain-containing protein [Sinorhizobium sp. BG8]